jgi:hypothetical protein
MGRYTELARRLRDNGPQQRGAPSSTTILSVNIDSIYSSRDSSIDKPTSERPKDTLQGPPPVDLSQSRASGYSTSAEAGEKSATNLRTTNLTNLGGSGESDTNLRTTNLTNLTNAERCIHERAPKKCAVCNGYARWLIAGGTARIEAARNRPEGTRRLYWRLIEGGKRS